MHVSPAKHSYVSVTDGQTDRRRTKWSLCVAMLRRRHKNQILHIKKSFLDHFLVPRNRFLDIKKCILRRRFTIYKVFLDIKNLISWYQEFISSYQEIEFLISRNEIHDGILDIKKSISWYQEICWINSKTAPHRYLTQSHENATIQTEYSKQKGKTWGGQLERKYSSNRCG